MSKVPKFHGGQSIICINCPKPEKLRIKFIDFETERYYLFPDQDGDEGFIPFNKQNKFKEI